MERLLTYPAGLQGAGLLLMRASAAAALMGGLCGRHDPAWRGQAAFVLAVVLLAGRLTRLSAGFCAAAAAVALQSATGCTQVLEGALALSTVALIILGPGAYSIDGQLYGRRVVRLPEKTTAPSKG